MSPKDIANKIIFTDENKKDKMDQLKTMLNGQEQLKNIKYEDVHLERYMYGSEFDVDAAFAKIVLFYDSLRNHPEWYQIVDPLDRMVIIEKDIRVMLPECDKEGRPIYISKNANVNVRTMTLPEVVSVDDIWLESLLANNPQITEKGLCVIVDIAKFPYSMMKWFTPEYIKLSLKKLQSLPFKDFRFHVVNNSMLIHAVLKILWPFLPEHIKQMVKFHFDDRNSLFEHIDPKFLPVEYGGTNNVDYVGLNKKLCDRHEEICLSFKSYRTFSKE